MTVQAGPWVGFWPSRTVDQASTTTLHCSSPVPCKAIPKAELYTLLHNFHKSLKFVNFAKMYH